MSEWLYRDDYAEVWQCYAHLPVRTMAPSDVMALVTPGSGASWTDELCELWVWDYHDTQLLYDYVATEGVSEPIIIGNDGRLWDGHHRLAVALALGIEIPARIVPSEAVQ